MYLLIVLYKGYEKRLYPMVNWACTEMTYQKSKEEDGQEISGSEQNIMRMVQEMMSKKTWRDKPSSKMFMKLFRYIFEKLESRDLE